MHTFKCSVLNKLFCYVIREEQAVLTPLTSPPSGRVRDGQEVILAVAQAAKVASLRDGQEVLLPVVLPSREMLRYTQGVVVIIVGHGRFPVTFVCT